MSAFDRQVGGDHYRDMAIQPFEFIERNGLSFGVGNVIKYLCRYKAKDGIEDLRKAKHYIDLLIDLELNHDKDDILDRLEVIEVGDVAESALNSLDLTSSDPGWTDRLRDIERWVTEAKASADDGTSGISFKSDGT